jgi:hypothetical protein
MENPKTQSPNQFYASCFAEETQSLSLSLFFLGLEFRVHPGHGDGLRLSNNFAGILRKSI